MKSYIAILVAVVTLQTVGQVSTSFHTIAKEPLTANGHTVSVRVMDDRTIIYQPFMTRTLVSMDNGKLSALETTAAHRGILIRHREPTIAETALWQKYFEGS